MYGAYALTSAVFASGLASDPLLEELEAALLARSAFSASRSFIFLCSLSTSSCSITYHGRSISASLFLSL